jgi:hypothetical protein
MKRRASLAMLMGLVAILAVGLAAIKVATAEASRAVFGSGLLVLLVGTLGSLVRRQGRASWIGFALFGWAYALVLLVPSLREAVAAELPGVGPLGEVVDLIHPPLASPAIPAFYLPPGAAVEKSNKGGYQYSIGFTTVYFTPPMVKQWEAYLGLKSAFDARVEIAHQARRIALSFLGLAFAFLGAAAGHALDDRTANSGATSAAGPSTSTG